jgi:hypothetical protein
MNSKTDLSYPLRRIMMHQEGQMNELRLWIAIGLSALAILLTVLNYVSSRRHKKYDMFLSLWQE